MRLKIVDINYTGKSEWLYKLSNGVKDDFYIMQVDFYDYHGLKTPITRQRLEYLDVGQWLNCNVEVVGEQKVVLNFI